MNRNLSFALLAALSVGVGGCGKGEPAPAATGGATDPAANVPVDPAARAIQAVQSARSVVSNAQQQANLIGAASATAAVAVANSGAPVPPSAQGFINEARALVAQKRYADASTLLQQHLAPQKLAQLKLTAEQNAAVDSLKAQIATALAGPGSGAIPGNPLGK